MVWLFAFHLCFNSVVLKILFSSSVFLCLNTVERSRKTLFERVSATVERSLSNCFARMVFTAYKKQHILHFCCWKSCVQLCWHCKVYQGVQAYGSICRQPGSGRAPNVTHEVKDFIKQQMISTTNFCEKWGWGGLCFSRNVYWQLFYSITREVSVSFDIISMFWSPGLCSYDWSSPFTAWVLNQILHSLSLKSYLTEELTARSGFLSGYINSDHKCQLTRRNNTFTPSLL